jgi:hypothetical protein
MSPLTRLQRIVCTISFLWAGIASAVLAYTTDWTTDEPAHLISGYVALTRHDYRWSAEHPYLFKYAAAAALLPLKVVSPPEDIRWTSSAATANDPWRQFFGTAGDWLYNTPGNNPTHMKWAARSVSWVVWMLAVWSWWALVRRVVKPTAALFALTLFVTNPLLLAHSSLITTDIPLLAALIATLLALVRYAEQPTTKRLIWAGLALLAVVTTKFSGIVLIAPFVATLIWVARKEKTAKLFWRHLGLATLVVWAGIWVVYGFKSQYTPWNPAELARQIELGWVKPPFPEQLPTIDRIARVLQYILPIDWLKGVLYLLVNQFAGRPGYLLGEAIHGRNLPYFPVLFVLKTPLFQSLSILIGCGWVATLMFRKITKPSFGEVLIGGTAALLTLGALTSKLHIGVRHAMPAIALSTLFGGMILAYLVTWLTKRSKRPSESPGLFLIPLLSALPLIGWIPHNLLAYGDPLLVRHQTERWWYYTDSNLDWGTRLTDTRRIVEELYPTGPIYYDWGWNSGLERPFGPRSVRIPNTTDLPTSPSLPLAGAFPTDGPIILSGSYVGSSRYTQLREHSPILTVGGVTYVYDLSKPAGEKPTYYP